jgi:arsenate reductase
MVPPEPVAGSATRKGIRGNRPRLRGDTAAKPPVTPQKKRVLFVCIGNSCRSQMAEAFARAYGADIMEVRSAGTDPATYVSPLTKQILAERNLNIDGQFPKSLELLTTESFDFLINMSGYSVSLPNARVLTWVVPDPIGQREEVYRAVAAQIEGLVMRFILELRSDHPVESSAR